MTTKKQGAVKKSAAAKGLTLVQGGKGSKLALKNGQQASPEANRRALGILGVEVAAEATPEQLLALLRKTLDKKLKGMAEKDKVKCTNVCGEVATFDTDFCPFCGDEGTEESAPGAEAAATGVEDPKPAAAAAEPEKAKKPAKGAAPAPSTAIAPTTTAEGLAAATARLDESMKRISHLKGDIAGNSYDLGLELKKIHEEELWKAKGYEDFKAFIEKSRAMAYRLIEVTRQFDRPTFQSVGSTKLALIAGIEDADARAAALDAAKAGANTRDVERHANDAKGRKAAPPKEPKGNTAPPKKTNPNEITLLTKVGSKPQLIGFRSGQSGRPIGHHKDDAYAEMQLADEVKLRMAPKLDKEGNIVGITVAFVRVE
jgi:hypothetical protein